MACCPWKRGEKDALFDNVSKNTYCGTCWQSYIECKLPTVSEAEDGSGGDVDANIDTHEDPKSDGIVQNEESLHPMQLYTHSDGRTYLVSKSRHLVFCNEHTRIVPARTDDVTLKCVGEIVQSSNAQNPTNAAAVEATPASKSKEKKQGKRKGKKGGISSTKPAPSQEQLEIKIFKVTTVAKVTDFPYETPPNSEDHCETPLAAYADLLPVLDFLCTQLGKSRSELRVYDPYYCSGSIVSKLGTLGFTRVINEPVDFYRHPLPKSNFDVLVTNPPYSTRPVDHIRELTRYLCTAASGKPWFVLQPNYVYTKDFWPRDDATFFFLTPRSPRKYKYRAPCGLRFLSSSQALSTSPFVTFWYCCVGNALTTCAFYYWYMQHRQQQRPLTLSLACTDFFIPDAFKDSSDKTRKKKKHKASKQQCGKISLPIAKKRHEKNRVR